MNTPLKLFGIWLARPLTPRTKQLRDLGWAHRQLARRAACDTCDPSVEPLFPTMISAQVSRFGRNESFNSQLLASERRELCVPDKLKLAGNAEEILHVRKYPFASEKRADCLQCVPLITVAVFPGRAF